MLPWDAHADALETLQLAERSGDAEGIAQARREVEDARRVCSLLGGYLLAAALDEPLAVQKLQRVIAGPLRELILMADGQACLANGTSNVLLFEIDALKQRIRELERRLDSATSELSLYQVRGADVCCGPLQKEEAV